MGDNPAKKLMEKITILESRYGSKSNHLEDDDIIDRLNNRITVQVLMMCIFMIVGDILVGRPINCWTPAEFKDPQNGYANSICWLKGSYYLPTDEITIPDRSKPRTYYVSYYQWTPFILLGMALFFLLPRYIWKTFLRQRGVHVDKLIKNIKDPDNSKKGVDKAQKALKSYLDAQYHSKGSICCGYFCSSFHTGYTLTYFFTKLFYVVNSLTQFFLLNKFLAFNFTSFGFIALGKIMDEGDWFESPRFPRVTMCDFMVRRLGSNQHWYSVQCNLPTNMLNEKIFVGIWLWLIILTILNILSVIPWIMFFSRGRRKTLIKKHLKFWMSRSQKVESSSTDTKLMRDAMLDKLEPFIDYLTMDGFLLFHIISHNTDDIVAADIISYLCQNFEPPRHYRCNVSRKDFFE